MDFVANERPQTLVNKLVARQLALVFEFAGHDQGLKMRVVVAKDLDQCMVESGLDQFCDFCWVHFVRCYVKLRGAQCTGNKQGFPMRRNDCV